MIDDPVIDARSGEDVVRQARDLRAAYTPDWTGPATDGGDALIAIFGRLMELMLARLNKTPGKNALAFLDAAGVSLLSPEAARTPLTFLPAAGAKSDGRVPAGTQAATAPLPGQEPLTFETEKDLVVSRSRLLYAFSHDPAEDRYDAHASDGSEGFSPFTGSTLIPHRLHVAQDVLFQLGHAARATMTFTLDRMTEAFATLFRSGLRWSIVSTGADITPQPGSVAVAGNTVTVTFNSLLNVGTGKIDGVDAYWLRAETKNPLSPDDAQLTIRSLIVKTDASGIAPASAFSNAAKLDIEREFFPFGTRPKTFDVFFLAAPEAFSKEGSVVTIQCRYVKGTQGAAGVALTFEYWNGAAWTALSGITDNTAAFTADPGVTGKNIVFTCPAMAKAEVNGAKDYWIRVRITSGNYGQDAQMTLKTPHADPPTLADWLYTAENYHPPIITSLTVSYAYAAGRAMTAVRLENNFSLATADPAKPFQPFSTPDEKQPACYFGFDSRFAADAVSLYIAVEEAVAAEVPLVVWEYCSPSGWKNLGVQDSTRNLTESGMVEFIGPADSLKRKLFKAEAYWLRARLEQGEPKLFLLNSVHLNTVWAGNTTTILNEVLGSSTETPSGTFTLTRRPVLDGLQLQVREPEQPAAEELGALLKEEGDDALSPVQEGEGAPRECWVRWHRVDHFLDSGEKSRHYVLDWNSGAVTFGDGVRGMAPPAGRNNIRANRYQAGGGSAGNTAANTVTVLKRAIPFIDAVYNADRAGGGSDGETTDHVRTRGPQSLKTRDRAVTWEDYEWLAREASFQVARARCLPAHTRDDAGTIRLILVPWSDEPKPYPSQGLIRLVKDYLATRTRRIATAELSITGPKYVEISVTANVIPERMEEADMVRRQVKERLTDFLHPLRGGPDSNGWEFGRDVFVSEIARVIEDTDGVDHAEEVAICSSFYEDGTVALSLLPGESPVQLELRADVGDEYLAASGEHLIAINGVSEPSTTPLPFLGNASTKELHNLRNERPNCRLDTIRASGHTREFACLGRALREGYDFCAWCFGRGLSRR